ncbi:hypothetical protein BDD12DRAFT_750519 [Trichophaea hybrida]|nr:hypothetical protein BDD12DRAFT_750519 [Trichophaea hybrida]
MTFVQKALRGTNIPLRGSGDSATCTTLEFKARNLDRLAGISILFTANLADHLVYDHDNNRLLIYHFNSFLTEHLTPSNVFDETFLRETQQTLSLIFPCWDADTTAYLNQLKKGNNIDVDSLLGNVTLMPRRFYSSDFEFYGVRLEDLRDALNSKQPFSIRQLWFDRRNRQAWCTLWVAVVVFILTIIFGVISSVTSIMQVKIALKMADGQGH